MMVLLIAAGVSVCSYMLLQTQLFRYIDVGVVIPEEEKLTKQIAQYISTMDSVQSICNFKYLTFDKVMEELESDEVQAVIALPENFYKDMDTGENTPATIYLPEDAPLNVKVFQELFLDGVSMVQISEAGTYAAIDTARQKEIQIKKGDVGDFIVTMYIESILEREDIFESYTESPLGQMNVYQYYVAAFFSAVLLMMGLNFGFLYQSHGKTVEEKFRMYGIGAGKKAVIKILVMTGILWILGMILYLLLCLATGTWEAFGVWADVKSIFLLLFFCLSLASFFHIVYVIAGGGFHGTVLLLGVNIGMILCSGTVLPIAYFPEIVGKIGKYLPLSYWNAYSVGILFGEIAVTQVLTALGFAVAGIGVGVVSEWKDM